MLSGISDPLLQRNVTRSHLEHQMAASIALKSAQEFQYWCVIRVCGSSKLFLLTCDVFSLQDTSLREVPGAG